LFGKTLLQHGSILLGPGHEQLAFCSAVQSEEKQQVLYDYILQHSANLEETCGRKISYEESANALIQEIEKS
jgi:lipoate-protein ligase A